MMHGQVNIKLRTTGCCSCLLGILPRTPAIKLLPKIFTLKNPPTIISYPEEPQPKGTFTNHKTKKQLVTQGYHYSTFSNRI